MKNKQPIIERLLVAASTLRRRSFASHYAEATDPRKRSSATYLAGVACTENRQNRWERVLVLARQALQKAGVKNGVMLEIGGRRNPRNADFPEFSYYALDLAARAESNVLVRIGDITGCPEIPDESYDFIFSLDVFEHIDKPWLAAQEISRLLKPGGVTFHSTLFSWRYHPCPIDYWRFTPDGLKSLFPELECTHSDFDWAERRRNILGRDGNRLVPDRLGGWRENVRVNYAGVKPNRCTA